MVHRRGEAGDADRVTSRCSKRDQDKSVPLRRERHDCFDHGSLAGCRAHLELAAEQARSLCHAAQAEVYRLALVWSLWGKVAPVIGDGEL